MAGFLDKVMNAMGLSAYDDDFFEADGGNVQQSEQPTESRYSSSRMATQDVMRGTASPKASSKVVNIHATTQMKVIVTTPETYDDAKEVCDHIKSKKPVVVNLEGIEKENAQKIMDFLSGSCYALDGTIQRVSGNIFIFAPENVDIAGNIKEELRTRGIILPWVK
ncbi:MAG: cell division protein SepF [Clostridia bacterium]|jgi:cell division inhibitor SepF|nr:cell division protein SepF [Clostridia bacterium]